MSLSLTLVFIITTTTVTLLQPCLSNMKVGGIYHIHRDKQHILNDSVVTQSVVLANQMLNSAQWYVKTNLTNLTTQIVSGLLYRYNLHLTMTNCTKNALMQNVKKNQNPNPMMICEENCDTAKQLCKVQVLFQPWKNVQYKIKILKCKPQLKSLHHNSCPPKSNQTIIHHINASAILNKQF